VLPPKETWGVWGVGAATAATADLDAINLVRSPATGDPSHPSLAHARTISTGASKWGSTKPMPIDLPSTRQSSPISPAGRSHRISSVHSSLFRCSVPASESQSESVIVGQTISISAGTVSVSVPTFVRLNAHVVSCLPRRFGPKTDRRHVRRRYGISESHPDCGDGMRPGMILV
jgi:hypothetical protein